MTVIRRAQGRVLQPTLALRNADGTGASGETAWYAIQRTSDGKWWDGSAWQVASWATVLATAAYHLAYTDQGNGAYLGAPWNQAAGDGSAERTYLTASYVSSPGAFQGAVAFDQWIFSTEDVGAAASVTGAVGAVTGAVGSVTGSVGSVASPVTVGTNSDKTGYALTSAYDAAKTAARAGDAMALISAYDAAKTAAQAGDAMTLTIEERSRIADAVLEEEVQSASATADSLRAAAKAAWAQGFGRWLLSGDTLALYGPDGETLVRAFTLDNAVAPTERTPA